MSERYKNNIDYAKEVIEHLPKEVLKVVDNSLDRSMHNYEYGKKYPDDENNVDMEYYRVHKEIAGYMLSELLSVDKSLVETAIYETARGYSKGNLRTNDITRKELMDNLENILKHVQETAKEPKYTIEELKQPIIPEDIPEYYKMFIKYVFNLAIEKYKEYINNKDKKRKKLVFPAYMSVKEAVYYMVMLFDGNYFDIHKAIGITVKECYEQKAEKSMYIKIYLKNLNYLLKKDKGSRKQQFFYG